MTIETTKAEEPVIVEKVVEKEPVKIVTPEKVPDAVKATDDKDEERPFYGLPDDPGVKEGTAKRDGTSGFRLF